MYILLAPLAVDIPPPNQKHPKYAHIKERKIKSTLNSRRSDVRKIHANKI